MSKKLEELRRINELTSNRIKKFEADIFIKSTSNDLNLDDLPIENIVSTWDTTETTVRNITYDSNHESKILIEEEFKRIVCIKGSIIIQIIDFNETITLKSPNTTLIPPNIKHKIKTLTDCELLVIYKPQKNFNLINLMKSVEKQEIMKTI